MRPRMTIALLATALAGCGETEDFAIEAQSPPAQVASILGGLDFSTDEAALPGLSIRLSRPQKGEYVFTMPASHPSGESAGESVIRLRLEPARGGSATSIHATADVPAVRALMGQANMELSESKVEDELRKALGDLSSPGKLKDLLVSVAIVSNSGLQSQVNTARLGKGRYSGGLALAGGEPVTGPGGTEAPAEAGWGPEPAPEDNGQPADTGGASSPQDGGEDAAGGWGESSAQ